MNIDYVVLQNFSNPVEANIVKGRLEAENIACFLTGEILVGLVPYFANNSEGGGIKLYVRPEEFEMANQILSDDLKEYKKTVTCKVCGSDKVHYVSTMRRTQNWFSLIFSMIFLLPMGYIKVYKCEACGSEIKMEE
jgi:hypothetical protein